ncbi:hypothetical protein TWF225_001618 [Orbilia oligospora]|uniref:Uncharacterized protein n=1 Tax=Orbilia oligospora TaxID=2813651 RepID=A0A7C8K2K4_ORBOL|nr:hypothetical protein TWF751_005206 [Orbilia oligospora]KAF3164631.1 hypothetical protein TWF225_001618 [Orbilia oligospora]KAF3237077.1 hypothetical protein TWF217_002205 [Orbilia oligospora]KAF3256738.1 hypothetical protein TWF128_005242 [Orbilia oligospora]KAF3292021.1 hypothetical protein TWF132_006266 [Orbilia oligospora]
MHIIKTPPPLNILSSLLKPSTISFSKSAMPGVTLPIPAPEPRRPSIWEPSFGRDWTLYPDSPTLSHTFDDVDLDDITKRGVSKAASFKEQEYDPAMLMYHPYDKTDAQSYPQPFEWERWFDDLANLPSQARSPSITSAKTMDTTEVAASASRRGSVQQFTPSGSGSSFSHITPISRRSSCADTSSRISRRQDPAAYLANKRLPSLLSSFSFCQSQDSLYQPSRPSQDIGPLSLRTSRTSFSLAPTITSTSTSSSRSASSLHPNAPRRRRSSTRRRNTALLLSHMGASLTSYRMDSYSSELQKVVSGIPISAFIHPKMHIPGSLEYGPVEEDGGYSDAYPLRHTRQWSFDMLGLADAQGDLVMDGIEWESVIAGDDGASSFEAA